MVPHLARGGQTYCQIFENTDGLEEYVSRLAEGQARRAVVRQVQAVMEKAKRESPTPHHHGWEAQQEVGWGECWLVAQGRSVQRASAEPRPRTAQRREDRREVCRCLCIGTTLREKAAADTRKGHGRKERAFLGSPASTRAGDHVVAEAPRLRAALVPRQAAHCNARVRSRRALLAAGANTADGGGEAGTV